MINQHIKTQLAKDSHLSSVLSADWLNLTSLKAPVISQSNVPVKKGL